MVSEGEGVVEPEISIEPYLIAAWESGRLAAEPLWKSSRGTFFYSVPHRGSPLADFNLPLLRRSVELLEISKSELANGDLMNCLL